ncbi:hypothetical protein [Tepidiphilus succinatimandens]|uniref:hypothetical protein n=1 Tax=Tepidiphilus succinatimandens TaxID=224436 RepID=UPI00197D0AAB|nr:hypothetical protein [Tepidiphilus succinatimandens]
MRFKRLGVVFALAILSAGCNQGKQDVPAKAGVKKQADAPLNQSTFCKVGIESLFGGASCAPGQKIAFLPDAFGNEQLPILFAARNCDMRYSVALTRGGVVCIYLPTEQGKASSEAGQKPESVGK